jgi:RHS repeat-associated protein
MNSPNIGKTIVQGTIDDPTARITVNGKEAINSGGTFTVSDIELEIGDNLIEAIAVDPAGNISTDSVNVTYAVSDELIYTTFSYDQRGNLTTKNKGGVITNYNYDYENRLISVSGGINYQYDGSGHRINKIVGGINTCYTYDGESIIQEDRAGGLAKYVYGPKVDEVISQNREGSIFYYHSDALSSTRSLSNNGGEQVANYSYDSYGKIRNKSGDISNEYTFTGRQLDEEAGLYYYRARYYDPETGRFLQQDPLGYVDGLNLYVYCGNNPVNFIDPFGMESECPDEEEIDNDSIENDPIGDAIVAGLATVGVGVAKGVIGWARQPAYWQYYPKNNPTYKTDWLAKGTKFRPPYKVGDPARRALNMPPYNKADAVRRAKILPKESVVGPRTPKPKPEWGWNKPGTGQEYYRGESFPD